MGWGKYFEDNVSVYVGRMIMRSVSVRLPKDMQGTCENPKVYRSKPRPARSAKLNEKMVVQNIDEHNRRGLELHFANNIEKAIEKKLRLNHWWRKPGKNIWYNNNTKINREFAKHLVDKRLAALIIPIDDK